MTFPAGSSKDLRPILNTIFVYDLERGVTKATKFTGGAERFRAARPNCEEVKLMVKTCRELHNMEIMAGKFHCQLLQCNAHRGKNHNLKLYLTESKEGIISQERNLETKC